MPERLPHPQALLIAKLPEALEDEQRRVKYDLPLARLVADRELGRFLRGASTRNEAGNISSVELEVELITYHAMGHIITFLFNLGAPLETVVHAETEKAVHELTISEATGVGQKSPEREFYDQLGAESPERPCRVEGCSRGAIQLSLFCRVHHFEKVNWKRCPFDD